MFFPAAAGIIQFVVCGVANGREISRVEKCSVIRQFCTLVAVEKSASFLAKTERHVHRFARRQRLLERVYDVEISRAGGDDVERPVEGYALDRLLGVGDMDLRDRLGRLVLQHKMAGSAEGAALRIDVDLRIRQK